MRKQMLDALHTAGRKLRGMDDVYAARWREVIGGPQGGNPARQLIGAVTGSPLTHGLTTFDGGGGVMRSANSFPEYAVAYGMPVASMTARYALPAAGAVALAQGLKGLYDLSSRTPVLPQDQSNQLSM